MVATLEDTKRQAIATKLADMKALQNLLIANEQLFINSCNDSELAQRFRDMLEDDHKNLGLKPRPFRTALHWMGGGLVPLFLLATALNILTTFDVLYSPFAWTVTGSCFLPVRIASGSGPVCIYPFAADYPRG